MLVGISIGILSDDIVGKSREKSYSLRVAHGKKQYCMDRHGTPGNPRNDGSSYVQSVEFEYLPPPCDLCCCFGHSSSRCSVQLKSVWKEKVLAGEAAPLVQGNASVPGAVASVASGSPCLVHPGSVTLPILEDGEIYKPNAGIGDAASDEDINEEIICDIVPKVAEVERHNSVSEFSDECQVLSSREPEFYTIPLIS